MPGYRYSGLPKAGKSFFDILGLVKGGQASRLLSRPFYTGIDFSWNWFMDSPLFLRGLFNLKEDPGFP